MSDPPVEAPKSRAERRFLAATQQYKRTCFGCERVIITGRTKGRSQAQLDLDDEPKVAAHVAVCEAAQQYIKGMANKGTVK